MSRKYKHGLLIPNDKEIGMHQMFIRGMNQAEIARMFNLTRERVRQILKRCFNATAKNNPTTLVKNTAEMIEKKIEYRKKLQTNEEMRYSHWFGCSKDVAASINEVPFKRTVRNYSTPAWKYLNQKKNAKDRGIEWHLTFPEWWSIWKESGRWSLRGRGHGYGMARYGDTGAYEAGNVYICTSAQNTVDYYTYVFPEKRKRHGNAHQELSRSAA